MVLKNVKVLKRELRKVLLYFYENYITKAYREVEVSERIRDLRLVVGLYALAALGSVPPVSFE